MNASLLTDGAILLILEAALKGTLILAAAWLATRAMPRASAAARHFVWATAIGALLLLPVLAATLPAWRVLPVRAPAVATLDEDAGSPATDGRQPSVPGEEPAKPAAPPAAEVPSFPQPEVSGLTPAPAVDRTRVPLRAILFVAWALGAVAVLGAFVGGHIALRRFVRSTRPFEDAEWLVLAQQCAAHLALVRPYAMLRGPATGMPFTFGLVHTRLLIPAAATMWPTDRRRAVLLHELAHVQRRDCLTQAMAQLACALFWFHPAIWYAARRLRIEREHACDDRVLAADTRASDYADHLMDVVKECRVPARSALGAVAFARPSQLESRVVAVLDPTLSRSALSSRLVARVSGLAGVLALSLAVVAPAARSAGEPRRARDPQAAAPSAVVKAPAALGTLTERLEWTRTESARRGERDFWVGYQLAPNPRAKGGQMGGDEGFDLEMLDDDWTGPSLREVIEGRAPSRGRDRWNEPGPLAILLRGSPRDGRFDPMHVRYQSVGLPVDLHRRPLYWLGEANDEESIRWLRSMSDDRPGGRLRSHLVEAIGSHARSDLVVPYLTSLVRSDKDDEVRRGAVEGLGMHPTDETRELLVLTARQDRSPEVRRQSAESLGQLGTPEAMQALLDLTRTSRGDQAVRRQAFDALGQQIASRAPDQRSGGGSENDGRTEAGEEPREVHQELRVVRAEFPDTEVQRQAVEALGRFPEEQSLTRLVELTDHPNPEVARQAAETIGRYGSDAAFDALTKVASTNRNPEVQRQAVEAMGRARSPEKAFAELQRIARTHPVRDVRRQAAETLGKLAHVDALGALLALTRDSGDVEVVRQSVESIGRLDDPRVMKILADIARSHPVGEARRQAVEAMQKHDPDGAVPYLEEILGTSAVE